jgi:hypothetical protein
LSGNIGKEEARVLATKETQRRAVREGTHPFLPENRTWDVHEAAKKASKSCLRRGTLNLLRFNASEEHSIRVSAHQKKLVKEGKHHFLKGNETWDRSSVSRELARKMLREGRCALSSENRFWNLSEVAKKARDSLSPEKLEEMTRKQTVNRRLNSGWTSEKLQFIRDNLPLSSSKMFNLCKLTFGWPSSRGVIQNIYRVLETEKFENILSL